MSRPHDPVLLDEVREALRPLADAVILDGTFGAGGYAGALLAEGARVLALDRDPSAAVYAGPLAAAHPGRFRLLNRRFSELEEALEEAGAPFQRDETGPDGIVFDLGVSSMQLDTPDRGFSFLRDGPLDMRMGGEGPTAADLVNALDEADLADLIWRNGEERASRRIARALVKRRALAPFSTTADLAAVVETALGGRRGAPTHPATRTFQALRIAVNDELGELARGLAAAERTLAPGGRLAVVTFHSLEDRIVKSFLTARSGKAPAPSRHRPPEAASTPPSFALLFAGAKAPSQAELSRNPRARSAKLRAAARTEAPAWREAA